MKKNYFFDIIGFITINIFFLSIAFPFVLSSILSIIIFIIISNFISDRYSFILLGLSLFFLVIIAEVSLNLLPYNPASGCAEDEFKIPGKEYYKPSKSVFKFPCGSPDNVRISGDLTLIEKTYVDFFTDSNGYRNSFEFNNNDYVVIGDSFTVGVTVSQEDMLSEQLSKILDSKVYNASFPTGPSGYHGIWQRMKRITQHDFQSIFLIFEGNDFFCSIEEVYGGIPPQKNPIYYTFDTIQRLKLYSFSYGLMNKVVSYYHLKESPLKINVKEIGNQNVGFLNWYIDVSERTKYCNLDNWNEVFSFLDEIENLSLVVFIPTKYRVYNHMFSNKKLPNLQGEFLQNLSKEKNFNYLDLTNALIERSNKLIEIGEYTFGRGDTHWNKNGITVAAEEISKKINPK